MVVFRFFDEIFPDLVLDLNILKRDSQRYSTLLYQHMGVLHVTPNGIKNLEDQTDKLNLVLNTARENGVDLLLTPEYSFPWSSLLATIRDESKWPSQGKIWVLSCEGISKAEFVTAAESLVSEKILLHYDKEPLKSNKTFFDPVVYLFLSSGENPQLVVLIQFKIHHMGAWGGGDTERNHMIQGNEIYVLRNSNSSIRLITLICSEAMNFHHDLNEEAREKLQWNDLPYLILHPQVNPDPFHEAFRTFRKFLLGFEKKDLIALNWNSESTIHGMGKLLRYGSSRSGFYIRSNEIEPMSLSRVRSNHKKGLYYFTRSKNKHAFILNSLPHLYHIDMPPVSIANVEEPQIRRDGPEVITLWAFADAALNQLPNVTDLHSDYLEALGCDSNFLLNPENCIIDKERLACICSGKIGKGGPTWYSVQSLYSVTMEESEVNKRLTFAEDMFDDSQRQRNEYAEAITILNHQILTNEDLYPNSIKIFIKDQPQIGFNRKINPLNGASVVVEEQYKYNLVDVDGNTIPATVCYLGMTHDGNAEEIFDSLQSLFDSNNLNRGGVVVYYKKGNSIVYKADPTAARFTNTNENIGPSFLEIEE